MSVAHGGGCMCGRVRYRIIEDPIAFYVCHCTDCQNESGTTFGLSMVFRQSALEHLAGELRSIDPVLPSGRIRSATLCSECLVRVWATALDVPQIVMLSPGTLDDPKVYQPWGNMWTASKQPWVSLAPGPCFERQPADPIAMVRAWQEHRKA